MSGRKGLPGIMMLMFLVLCLLWGQTSIDALSPSFSSPPHRGSAPWEHSAPAITVIGFPFDSSAVTLSSRDEGPSQAAESVYRPVGSSFEGNDVRRASRSFVFEYTLNISCLRFLKGFLVASHHGSRYKGNTPLSQGWPRLPFGASQLAEGNPGKMWFNRSLKAERTQL